MLLLGMEVGSSNTTSKPNGRAISGTLAIVSTKESLHVKSTVIAMLIVFFDKKGVVHSEFETEEQTVNGVFYVTVLKRLKRRVNRV